MRVDFLKKIFALTLTIAGIAPAMAEEPGVHRFATYNIRYVNANNGDTGDKLWANRRTAVTNIVKDYDFDIVGFQEVTGNNKDSQTGKSQLQDLIDMLPDYGNYAVEREGKNYSYNAIFYKKSKYTVVDKGMWYINEHPSTPGLSWKYFGDANTIARTLEWILFRDNASQTEFYFACTHMNYSLASSGVYGAELNARMLRELVGETPVVLVGDFNMHRSHEDTYRNYKSQFYDAALHTTTTCNPKGNITHTGSNWYPATNANCSGSEFDYQFYDNIVPLSREIITEDYNRALAPSDHFPVLVRYKFQDTPSPTSYQVTNTDELLVAVAKATMNDTIYLAQGEYELDATIQPTVSLTFVGGYDKQFSDVVGVSKLRQKEAKQVFNIPQYYSLTLYNLHLENGSSTSALGGGLLAINGSKLNLYNCRFSNSQSTTNAGALYANTHDTYIENCVFDNDTAKTSGGAIYAETMESLTIIDSKFHHNGCTTGAALYVNGGRVLNIQCNGFYDNISNKQGALTIVADQYSAAAHLVNNSFLNNQLIAKKGLATATKDFGGAGLYAKMYNDTQLFNIAHCSFIGNHTVFAGTKANFGGGALRIAQGKSCMMNNLLLANAEKASDTEYEYVDYTIANAETLWRNTENLLSNSESIADWENDLVNTIAGLWKGKVFTADVRDNGTYVLKSKMLNGFNLCYLTTNHRLCESAFEFDIDGDGSKSNYLKYDQIHNTRAIKACVGALEYKEGVTSITEVQPQDGIQRVGEYQYVVTGVPDVLVYNLAGQCVLSSNNETIDLSPLPSGLYIVNQHKIIR